MTQGKNLFIAWCEGCHKKGPVSEVMLASGRIIRLCEECLGEPYWALRNEREARQARDREGDKSPEGKA